MKKPAAPAIPEQDGKAVPRRHHDGGRFHWGQIYVAPGAIALVVGVLGLAVHLTWAQNRMARDWLAFAMLLAAVTFAGCMWWFGRHREPFLRILVLVSVGDGWLWLTFAGLYGPGNIVVLSINVFLAVLTVGLWMGRHSLLGGRDAQPTADDRSIARAKKSLDGARLGQTTVKDNGVVEIDVEVDRGRQTIDDLQRALPNLATALGTRAGAMQLAVKDPDGDSGFGTLTIVPGESPNKRIVNAPKPTAPGKSIADAPVHFGTYIDAVTMAVWLCGDHAVGRALAHILLAGMSGSGKSNSGLGIVTDALTRYDVQVIAHDHVKGIQTLGPLVKSKALYRVSMDLRGGKLMLARVYKAIRKRTDYLGENGYKAWEKGCGLTLLIVWVNEASALGDSETLESIALEARSAGILIILDVNRPDHTNLSTTTRAQLGIAICHGVKTPQEAKFVLSDVTRAQGAAPEDWGISRPGMNYIEAPGIPQTRWSTEGRSWFYSDEYVTATAASGNAWREPMDPITESALGPDWTPEEFGGPPATSQAGEQTVDGEVMPDQTTDQAQDVDEERTEKMRRRREDDPAFADMLNGASVNDPVDPLPDIPLNNPMAAAPKLTEQQAKEVIQDELHKLWARGTRVTSTADIWRMGPAWGRGRESLRTYLRSLANGGAEPDQFALELEDIGTPGVYIIIPPNSLVESVSV